MSSCCTEDSILAKTARAVHAHTFDLDDNHTRSKVYHRGVSRSFLRDLLSDLRAGLRISLTPGQLVWGSATVGPRNYLQFDPFADPHSLAAITQPTSLSFVETAVLAEQDHSTFDGSPFFGPATVFVSYGWHGAIVAEQIESLLAQTNPGNASNQDFFWIDIFAVAQNQTTD